MYGFTGAAADIPAMILFGGGNYTDSGLRGVFTDSDPYTDKVNINYGYNLYMNQAYLLTPYLNLYWSQR